MKYISTRGEAPVLEFSDVLLQGLARDGGLYLPETWPQFDADTIASFAGKPYQDVAFQVISPFVGGAIPEDDLKSMIAEAYDGFRHPAVTPLVQTAPNTFILELFHGPTLAFKDVAMQLLGRMMDYVLSERDLRATIVGATSGDTGGAAIEAFRGRERTDIFILFPDGRISNVQRRQMTTPAEENVHALALTGNFDDCQAILKGMFNHFSFRDRVALSGVNSINWARILAQIVYYFVAGAALGAPHRKISFTVPTGNFGDIFAGYAAMKMGLPVEKLVVATNVNDILARTLETGRYEKRGVTPTISPSMDIQVSSNFERLLAEVCGRDGGTVRRMMNQLSQSGSFEIEEGPLREMRAVFGAGRCNEDETEATIAETWNEAGYLLDPHTAIGVHVAKDHDNGEAPMVVLGTAHPAKFPDAVEKASGNRPELPENLKDMMTAEERQQVLAAEQGVVEKYIEDHARAVTAGV
ncbi:threonine synthase [Stappia aggregata IAM 12614]|uniref:Threonine synthase n=1 Tax=Roseibium aggregatum (strain ATCC 25650 / DSM 13394 / JCM 20685 / NBRC 16684 / NCIMB 2208 / IAM 12614 / B1) TaxID=384765 RepID=A0NV86_ROSAI|nr:threonine synthase [Roseibium aggregatum]EAV43353.1 threonine synthase [Stappia aggregata IAM 12614] [Roseibium aggregatum IAM 12614]